MWPWPEAMTSEAGSMVLPVQVLSASWLGVCSSLGVIGLPWKRKLTFLSPARAQHVGLMSGKKEHLHLVGHVPGAPSCSSGPSSPVKVCTPPGNRKYRDCLRETVSQGTSFIFQCLWHFFLLFEQETSHFCFVLGATDYVIGHGHGCQVSSMVLQLLVFVCLFFYHVLGN